MKLLEPELEQALNEMLRAHVENFGEDLTGEGPPLRKPGDSISVVYARMDRGYRARLEVLRIWRGRNP